MKKEKLNKGNLIVANANTLSDLNFNRTVILLTDNSENGTIGFILNKNLNIKLCDIVADVACNFKVYYGGPVEPENLYFIHNVPNIITDSIEIADGIYWGGDFYKIIDSLNEKKLKKSNIRFFLGYTGWDSDQLDLEIESEFWLIKDNFYKRKLLNEVPSNLWKELMMTFGENEIIWCNSPENPVMN